ncbi:Spliceosome-associated protein 49 [Dispira parvispora]|uniref:Splicing factor 3B subunit 4 n=1 Tax=Dispira parvispora TaxID=1520584 RepID=A0A9W8ATY8_9FUNG|nr:Spliceosome-associated protein 49 [Dispira parvispora]
MANVQERNQDATVYIGNIDDQCTDDLIWELMVQAGPVVNVHLPRDRVTQQHQGYGFCEFVSEEDADYAVKILNMIKLYGKPIRVNKANSERKDVDVGAKLYIGNLDPDVDEKLLYDTFSAFGQIIHPPKVARDVDTGRSRGFAFISFNCFEASDSAIESMDGQFLANKPIVVNYALKKDGKGERHGSAAERLLATQGQKNDKQQLPNQRFAASTRPPVATNPTDELSSGVSAPPPLIPPPPYYPQAYGVAPPPMSMGMPGYGMPPSQVSPRGFPNPHAPPPDRSRRHQPSR